MNELEQARRLKRRAQIAFRIGWVIFAILIGIVLAEYFLTGKGPRWQPVVVTFLAIVVARLIPWVSTRLGMRTTEAILKEAERDGRQAGSE